MSQHLVNTLWPPKVFGHFIPRLHHIFLNLFFYFLGKIIYDIFLVNLNKKIENNYLAGGKIKKLWNLLLQNIG